MTRNFIAAALLCLVASCAAAPAIAFHPDCGKYGMECAGASPSYTAPSVRLKRSGMAAPVKSYESPAVVQGGLVPELSFKLSSIESACPGAHAISTVRHTLVAGTRRMSLHAEGKAVDVRGDYRCIYAQLVGWPGGYSTDPGRVRHIHISYDTGGREWGIHFRHGHHRARHRRK